MRTPPPRTSFVIPARDAALTLAQTLNSVLAQSDGDWEALVVDDGSSDETPRIATDCARRDARIVFIAGGHGDGASATRNRGIELARGRRLVFLDSDDWIDPAYLARMNAALDAAPQAVAAYCAYCRVMPDGSMAPPHDEPVVQHDPLATFAKHCAVAIHAVLVEREAVQRAGGFDAALRTCEDWDLWLRIARAGGAWVHVDAVLAFYRQRSDSLSADTAQFLIDGMVVIRRGLEANGRAPGVERSQDAFAGHFALWCCAADAGRGRRLEPTPLDLLQRLSPQRDHQDALLGTLVEALAIGAQATPSQLAERWPHYGRAVIELIDTLGRTWSDADAARSLHYALQGRLLRLDGLAAPRVMASTLGLRVNLRRPAPLIPPPGIDRVVALLCDGDKPLGTLEIGMLGRIEPMDWIRHAGAALGPGRALATAALPLLRSMTPRRLVRTLHAAAAPLRGALRAGHGRRAAARAAASRVLQTAAARSSRSPGSHASEIERLRDEARRIAPAATAPRTENAGAGVDPALEPGGDSRHEYWEQLFRNPDPWQYSSAYEQEKYGRQLSLLPERPIGEALELACAEGHFTRMLAPRVQRLIASDISSTAVARAAERCSAQRNVEYRRLDFIADALPAPMDLIVCSEVLYYLPDLDTLARIGERIAQALRPGGCLITAHAYVVDDDRTTTGFDWGHPWGAKSISRVLAAVPQLALERSVCTSLYRIDRFVRGDGTVPRAAEPIVETLPIHAELEHEVARCIVWGGALATRTELAGREHHRQIPVLMYHRIANDGPQELAPYRVGTDAFAEQLSWLRRHGYHAICADKLSWYLEGAHPFPGRPVMITFDDAYQDFADMAWPALRRHDFNAEVFVVTDLAGGFAEWDRSFGEPARLMSADTIAALAGQGARFGSHLATHRRADGLTTAELAQELLRSGCAIERWTGLAPRALAAPYGVTDARLRQLAADCGYRIGLSTQAGAAALGADPLNLPRIEVRGDMAIDEFASVLEAAR